MIDEYITNPYYTSQPFEMTIVQPKRTFIEKVCLLHEEFNKGKGEVRHNRMSRHLYDLYVMCQKGIDKEALSDEELFCRIVSHRFIYNRIDGVDYNTESPGLFRIVPPDKQVQQWEKDYEETMRGMIYSNTRPSFEELILCIHELNSNLNKMQRQTTLKFIPGKEAANERRTSLVAKQDKMKTYTPIKCFQKTCQDIKKHKAKTQQ